MSLNEYEPHPFHRLDVYPRDEVDRQSYMSYIDDR